MEGQSLEAALIARCQEQDAAAFDLVVQRYGERIYNYIRRMVKHPQDAEDLTQEVFVRAFANLHQFDGRSQMSTWLFRIASNLCIDHFRRRKRRPEFQSLTRDEEDQEMAEYELPDERLDPLDSLLRQELRQVVEQAVENLPPKLRTVLLLYDVEGLPYEEIAQVVGIPLGTVKSRLFMARTQVKRAVEKYLGGS